MGFKSKEINFKVKIVLFSILTLKTHHFLLHIERRRQIPISHILEGVSMLQKLIKIDQTPQKSVGVNLQFDMFRVAVFYLSSK